MELSEFESQANFKYEWKQKIKTGKHQVNIILTNPDPPNETKTQL